MVLNWIRNRKLFLSDKAASVLFIFIRTGTLIYNPFPQGKKNEKIIELIPHDLTWTLPEAFGFLSIETIFSVHHSSFDFVQFYRNGIVNFTGFKRHRIEAKLEHINASRRDLPCL